MSEKISRAKGKVYLTGSDFVKFYTHQVHQCSRPKEKRIVGTNKVINIVGMIFDEVAKSVTQNIAGIHLYNIGYFGVWRSSTNLLVSTYKNKEIFLNSHTDGYQYVLDFFPDTTNNTVLHGWTMDRMFSRPVKQTLSANLRKGYKYKNFYEIFLNNRENGIKN